MSLQLPEAIKTYFTAANAYDSSLLATCFAEDAILYDEGSSYHGPDAIEAHMIEASHNLKVQSEMTSATEQGGKTIVTATISGNFDGSPVALDYEFTMKDQKIAVLTITSASK